MDSIRAIRSVLRLRPDLVVVRVLLLVFASNAMGSVIRVPEDSMSIQAAIAVALDGDTVSVGPGTYAETVDFLGKAITVVSRTGPEKSIIEPVEANGVTFRSGESRAAVLEGFTIRGGVGVTHNNSSFGGGIFCLDASPTIRGNVIVANRAGMGGGVGCVGSSSPRFVKNEIFGNQALFGGGIACGDRSTALFESNVILENHAYDRGGGIFCYQEASPAFVDNKVMDNGADMSHAAAAFIYASATPTFWSNWIAGNETFLGAGIEVVGSPGFRAFDNVFDDDGWYAVELGAGSHDAEFIGNRFLDGGLSILASDDVRVVSCEFVGATPSIRGYRSSFSIDRCAFRATHARAEFTGPCEVSIGNSIFTNAGLEAIYGREGAEVSLVNCTIFDNNDVPLRVEDSSVAIVNSILWGNVAKEIRSENSTVEISYSVVEGGYPGDGNLDIDPRLVDPGTGEYHLRIGSPCIDAGSAGVPGDFPLDLDGDVRFLGTAIDIGADEFRGDIAIRFGYVDDKARTVLRVNGTHGDHERIVHLAPDDPVSIDMTPSPAGPTPARFALYAWLDQPDATTFTRQPFNLGWTVFPTPLQGAGPNAPILIWNNLGRDASLGSADRDSTPAPSVIADVPTGVGRVVDLTLQGFLEDYGSRADGPVSITNAIVLIVASD